MPLDARGSRSLKNQYAVKRQAAASTGKKKEKDYPRIKYISLFIRPVRRLWAANLLPIINKKNERERDFPGRKKAIESNFTGAGKSREREDEKEARGIFRDESSARKRSSSRSSGETRQRRAEREQVRWRLEGRQPGGRRCRLERVSRTRAAPCGGELTAVHAIERIYAQGSWCSRGIQDDARVLIRDALRGRGGYFFYFEDLHQRVCTRQDADKCCRLFLYIYVMNER